MNNACTFTENKIPRVLFTEEMAREYTILIPSMLPMHFELFEPVFSKRGYKVARLSNESKSAIDEGVRFVHNDACYPAICVIGQFLEALESGKYDVDKTALMYIQTGGGCRASNYVSLLRKALQRAGMPQVPVIAINFFGSEKQPGFKMNALFLLEIFKCLVYGDLLTALRNQCLVREVNKGETEALTRKWIGLLAEQFRRSDPSFAKLKKTMRLIADDFASVERGAEVTRVGIVGEIYVKYSPLGNNGLEKFLHSEGAETVVPGVLDFCYYFIYNAVNDYKLYGMNKNSILIWRSCLKLFEKLKDDINDAIGHSGHFIKYSSYKHLVSLAESTSLVGTGLKMGEGWLLPAEMMELCDMGVKNIVCTQPFGCLPNHIIGKGMMRPVKDRYPDANIVAIDYDPGASKINQENRLKLMLANARRQDDKP